MPDEDDGWGGTVDHGWGNAGSVPTPADAKVVPAPSAAPVPGPSGGRNRLLIVAGIVVVVVAVLVAVILNSRGSHQVIPHNSPSPTSDVSLSATTSAHSATPTTVTPSSSSGTATVTDTGSLLKAAPFGSDCQAATQASYYSSAVTAQIACVGSTVSSKVGAAGVSYALFSSAAGLTSWYSDTILKANGIASDAGNCTNGTTISTNGGAEYCESAFTDDTGASDARQLIVRAPASISLTNGPNSTAGNCPNSDYTLLVVTSPSDNVGMVALTCSSSTTVASAFESSLVAGAFDLSD